MTDVTPEPPPPTVIVREARFPSHSQIQRRFRRRVVILVFVLGCFGCGEEARDAPIALTPKEEVNDVGSVQTTKQAVADRIARIKAAMVLIRTEYYPIDNPNPKHKDIARPTGSGFVVSRHGLILTNEHVVTPVMVSDKRTGTRATKRTRANHRQTYRLKKVTVAFNSGTKGERVVPAQVVATNAATGIDLAILRVESTDPLSPLSFVTRADFKEVQEEQEATAVGFPLSRTLGTQPSFERGNIRALRKGTKGFLSDIQFGGTVIPGNSGGPLVDMEGRVLGVIRQRVTGESIGIATSMQAVEFYFGETLRRFLNDERGFPDQGSRTISISEHQSFSETVRSAHPGDIILLAAGDHHLGKNPLLIPGEVWIRGKGKDATRLHGRIGIKNEARGIVISDLTLNGSLDLSMGSRQVELLHLHDMRIRAGKGQKAVVVSHKQGLTMKPTFINCEIVGSGDVSTLLISGPYVRPRFERTEFHRVRGHRNHVPIVFATEHAKATFVGCSFRAEMAHIGQALPLMTLDESADVTVRGSHFRTRGDLSGFHNHAALLVEKGTLDMKDSHFDLSRGMVEILCSARGYLDVLDTRFVIPGVAFVSINGKPLRNHDFASFSYPGSAVVVADYGLAAFVRRCHFITSCMRDGVFEGNRQDLRTTRSFIIPANGNVYGEKR